MLVIVGGLALLGVRVWAAAVARQRPPKPGTLVRGANALALLALVPHLLLPAVLVLHPPTFLAVPIAHTQLSQPLASVALVGGAAVGALGLLVMAWAHRTLGQFFSLSVQLKEDHRLITTGPYAHVRNPIYTGAILLLGGSAVMLSSPLLLLAHLPMSAGLLRMGAAEEELLARSFGEEYRRWHQRTGALLPRLRTPIPPA